MNNQMQQYMHIYMTHMYIYMTHIYHIYIYLMYYIELDHGGYKPTNKTGEPRLVTCWVTYTGWPPPVMFVYEKTHKL